MISAEDSMFIVYSNISQVLPTYGPTFFLHEKSRITVMVLQCVLYIYMYIHTYIYIKRGNGGDCITRS